MIFLSTQSQKYFVFFLQSLKMSILTLVNGLNDQSQSESELDSLTFSLFPPIRQRNFNPYSLLPVTILSHLLTNAYAGDGVAIRGSRDILVEALYNLDQTDPSWRRDVLGLPFSRLRLYELLLGAALKGVDIQPLYAQNRVVPENMTNRDLYSLLVSLLICPRLVQINQRPIPQVVYNGTFKNITDAIEYAKNTPRSVAFRRNNVSTLITKPQSAYRYYSRQYNVWIGLNEELISAYLTEISIYPINTTALFYLLLWNLKSNGMKYALDILGINIDIALLLNREQLIFTLSRGNIPPEINIDTPLNRLRQVRSLPENVRDLIFRLYRSNDTPVGLASVASINPPHPLEEYILSIGRQPPKNIAASIGMIIPPDQDDLQYLLANILRYRHVVSRDPLNIPSVNLQNLNTITVQNLKYYTDQEIFDLTKAYVPYISRRNLLELIVNIANTPNFFLPYTEPENRACINRETAVDLEDVKNPDLFIVSYGILAQYTCVDKADMMGSFQEIQSGNQRLFFFRNVTQPTRYHEIRQIEQLLILLRRFPEGNQDLIDVITRGLNTIRTMAEGDFDLIIQFNSLPESDRSLIQNYLETMFNAGMYMRQWGGPGTPYPLRENQTGRTNSSSPFANVTVQLNTMRDLYNRMTPQAQQFINTLPAYDVSNRAPYSFVNEFDRVYSGTQCIRLASSVFVGTSYKYQRLLLNSAPNIDITQLERIA